MAKVTLRTKKLKSGKLSLYLDYYPEIINPKTGEKTRREFLNIHVFDQPKNQEEKKNNSDGYEIANIVKSKRELQLRNKEFGFKENVNISVDLINFYQSIVDEYYNTGSEANYNSWKASLNHLKNFSNGKIMTSQIDSNFVSLYRNYLLKANSTRNSEKPKKLSKIQLPPTLRILCTY